MKKTRDNTRFPGVAYWIFSRLLNQYTEVPVLRDLQEEFFYLCGEKGPRFARFWVRLQLIKSLPFLIRNLIYWSIIMFKNYLKISLRNILKQKSYSFINIAGLAMGIAVFILIALYVQHELSFDTYHDNADRIYRVIQEKPGSESVGKDKFATTPPALAPALMQEFPEIVSAARIGVLSNTLVSGNEKNFIEAKVHCTEPEIFEIFSIPFVKGDAKTALNDPFSILLSERTAEKYFSSENPVGKVLNLGEKFDFKVTGVFKNMPENSHFTMAVVIPFVTYFQFKFGPGALTEWSDYSSFYAYCLLREGAVPEESEKKFPVLLDKYKYHGSNIDRSRKAKYLLQPLTDIHLHSGVNVPISSTNSDIKYIILFSSIAFLILIIACINYMNLTTARSVQRAKEVGLRRVVGAKKSQLVKQLLGESFIFTLLALIASLFIIWLTLPVFNNFIERQLSFNPVQNPHLSLTVVLIILFAGLFAGSYPAFYISAFKPVTILKGAFKTSSKGAMLRNLLVMVQFSITIILVIATLIIRDQLHFINNRDMGYDKEQAVVLHVGDAGTRKNFHNNLETIKAELKRNPGILSVAGSKRLPNNINFNPVNILPGKAAGTYTPIYAVWGDDEFVNLYGIKIIQGRNFSKDFPADKNGAILLNETAAKTSRWESPIGKEITYWGNRTGKIVGIMKDFHFHSLHSPIEPLCIYYEPEYFDYLSIKINAHNIPQTIVAIEKVIKKFSPKHPFEYHFFDEIFERSYRTEQKTGKLYGVFAFLSIIIACLGLLGLASFAAAQRTKEVGIRKSLGASTANITLLFLKEFVKWVFFANLIAWPVAYYAMNKWLQNFAYRTSIGIGTFILSGLIALLIALFTVAFQSIKAAGSNPVEALKYE